MSRVADWLRAATIAVLGLTLVAATPAGGRPAAVTGFFVGTLNSSQPVSLSLRAEGDVVSGYYYYDRIGEDIPLRGAIAADGTLQLDEFGKPQLRTGHWSVRLDASDASPAVSDLNGAPVRHFSGHWQDLGSKRTLPIALDGTSPLAASPPAFRPLAAGEPPHAAISVGAISYRQAAVRRTGVQYPRLTAYQDDRILRSVNSSIDRITADFGCEGRRGQDQYFQVDAAVTYAADDVFSILGEGGYYCGGAHPEDIWPTATFDLKSGRQLAFPDLFRDYAPPTVTAILAAIIAARTAQQAVPDTASGDNAASCEELFALDNLRDTDFAFALSRDGLYLIPASWPHVVAACAEPTIVPYPRLKPFAAPGGVLARVGG
ncbi:hypothetical protein HQ394_11415 [Defluviicoccus vanus]|uniref:DUF3298 domain-containing protein n=1 Tax=Defluviicoccus vanus TaxID=111831 RepID=A0A7H1N275_9PROT|nr:hypothetical protein HQ394_11415 [Defluviicoccus vanus]